MLSGYSCFYPKHNYFSLYLGGRCSPKGGAPPFSPNPGGQWATHHTAPNRCLTPPPPAVVKDPGPAPPPYRWEPPAQVTAVTFSAGRGGEVRERGGWCRVKWWPTGRMGGGVREGEVTVLQVNRNQTNGNHSEGSWLRRRKYIRNLYITYIRLGRLCGWRCCHVTDYKADQMDADVCRCTRLETCMQMFIVLQPSLAWTE